MSLIEAAELRVIDKRRAARRTALIVGAVAVAVYAAFLLIVSVGAR